MELIFDEWLQELQNTLDCPLVEMRRSNKIPSIPYVTVSYLTEQGAPKGTSCEDNEGTFWQDSRKLSFHFIANTNDGAYSLARQAQVWLLTEGRVVAENFGLCVGTFSNLQLRTSLMGSTHEFRVGFEVEILFLLAIAQAEAEGCIEEVQFPCIENEKGC